MHLKNFSLIETAERSGEYVLSPTYDLLPINVIMPEDAEQTALAPNGKKQNIRRLKIIFFRVMILIFLRSHDIKAPFNVAVIFLIRPNLLMRFFSPLISTDFVEPFDKIVTSTSGYDHHV